MSQHKPTGDNPNVTPGSEVVPKLGPVRRRARPELPQTANQTESDGAVAASGYTVGYGKPPRHTQFKPGCSGNPKGRPKGAIGLKTLVKSVMTEKVTVRTAKGRKKMTRIEANLRLTDERAKTNQSAANKIMDLYERAVPETSEDNGQEEREVPLTLSDRKILEMFAAQSRAIGEGGS